MTPGLLKTIVAAAVFAASLSPSLAEARGLRVRVGGHVHVSGGVAVQVGAPPPVYYRPSYPVYYGPSYPAYPSYPQYYAPAPAVAVVAEPRRPMFGIGVMASSVSLNGGDLEGQGAGLLARLRLTPRFQLELQLSQDQFVDNPRVDTRFGGAALFALGKPGGLTPYLVLGAGVNVLQPYGQNDHADASQLPTQGYLEAGIGLEWEIFPRLALSGDLRLQARRFDQHSQTTSARVISAPQPEKEDAAEGRVNLILYF